MRRSLTYTSLGLLVVSGVNGTMQDGPIVSPLTSEIVHTTERHPLQLQHHAKVLFVGDMMFDRYIRKVANEKGYEYVFSCVADSLQEYDAVIGNLEGPMTRNASVSVSAKVGTQKNTQFTFAPEVAPVLFSKGIFAVSLGNNHMRDFGKQGAEETIRLLSEAGIASAGVPHDVQNASTTISVDGIPITLVPYNQFLGTVDETLDALHTVPEESFTVVFPHWGDEYSPATDAQKKLARVFVSEGADAVIGSHPHVIQENEVVDGAPIFYSLGNFIFDQYWDDNVRTGKGVVLTLSERGIESVDEKLFTLERDGRTCPKEVSMESEKDVEL